MTSDPHVRVNFIVTLACALTYGTGGIVGGCFWVEWIGTRMFRSDAHRLSILLDLGSPGPPTCGAAHHRYISRTNPKVLGIAMS